MSCNLMKASLLPLSTHLQTANDERGLWGGSMPGPPVHAHTHKHMQTRCRITLLPTPHRRLQCRVKQGEDCYLRSSKSGHRGWNSHQPSPLLTRATNLGTKLNTNCSFGHRNGAIKVFQSLDRLLSTGPLYKINKGKRAED